MVNLNNQMLLKVAPIIASVLFDPNRPETITSNGNTWPILNFQNGAVRAVDIGNYRFMTQNPLKNSVFGQMAQQGHKIVWVVHQPTNTWPIRVLNGKAELWRRNT